MFFLCVGLSCVWCSFVVADCYRTNRLGPSGTHQCVLHADSCAGGECTELCSVKGGFDTGRNADGVLFFTKRRPPYPKLIAHALRSAPHLPLGRALRRPDSRTITASVSRKDGSTQPSSMTNVRQHHTRDDYLVEVFVRVLLLLS